MIEELLPEEKRRLHELEQQVAQLERGGSNNRGNGSKVNAGDVGVGLKELSFRLEELDKLVQNESKARRDDFRRRVQHLKTNYNHVKSSFDAYVKRNSHDVYASQKEQLLSEANHNRYGNATDIELEMAESGSLDRSGRMVNDYIALGKDTLSELYSQRNRLKEVQKKVFDILNYLGIANSIIKAVEKRDFTDKWIVFIGALCILLLLAIIWWFRR